MYGSLYSRMVLLYSCMIPLLLARRQNIESVCDDRDQMKSTCTGLQAVYQAVSSGNTFSLQEFIVLFGLVELALSQLPDIHSLRLVNLVCMCCTVGFAATAFGLSIHNGKCDLPSSINYFWNP